MANFNFTEIPLSDPEIRTYGRGMEMWHGDLVNIPSDSNAQPARNEYERSWFTWAEMEPNKGQYNFEAELGRNIRRAIDAKRMYSFGIMSIYDNDGTNSSPRSGGYGMSYPLWLHNEMMSEAVKPAHFGVWWVPNYNSNFHLDALDRFNQALNTYLNNTTHNGVKLADAIYYIDIRNFGNWGEWHHYPFMDNMSGPEGSGGAWPVGMTPSMNTFRRIIDSYCNYLGQFQLVAMIAAFDCRWLNNTWNPPELAVYLMDKVYGNGKRIGIRRDNWAEEGVSYTNDWWERNNRATLNGQPISYHMMERWKYAPVGGEPSSAGYPYSRLPGEVDFYHVSYMGNGNYYGGVDGNISANFRAASKKMGHRFVISGGSSNSSAQNNGEYTISLNWQNKGNAPAYEDWDVVYELQNRATNAVVWSGKSSMKLKGYLPEAMAKTVSDTFFISGVSDGSYRLVVKVKDPKNYKDPLALYVQGRRADGSYMLLDSVSVTQGNGVPPSPEPSQSPLPEASITPTPSRTPSPLPSGSVSSVSTIFGTEQGSSTVKNDGQPLTVGVKFKASENGYVTKIRYWKNASDSNVGKTAILWSSAGQKLAEAQFSEGPSTGWQVAMLSQPVAVTANTVYVAGYHTSGGNYVSSMNYFDVAKVSGKLTAGASGDPEGPNGVYIYGPVSFPNNSYNASNYWVDVEFTTVSVPTASSTPTPTRTKTPSASGPAPTPSTSSTPEASGPAPSPTPSPTVPNNQNNGSPMVIQTILAGNGNLAMTNQPSDVRPLGNTNRYVTSIDLTDLKQFKLVAYVMTGSTSANSPKLFVQYSVDNGATWNNLSDTENSVSISTVGHKQSDWSDVTAAARTSILVRVAQSGGNGTADPSLGNVSIHYK